MKIPSKYLKKPNSSHGDSVKIKITDEMGNNNEKEIKIGKISVNDLLNQLNIDPIKTIVTRKDEIITENEIISNEDEIKVISVIHGG